MNTNAKHTPGPWIAHGITINHEQPGVEYPIATTTHSPIPTEEAYANARLIASAPDLLAALKSAVSYLEANRPKGNIREIFTQLNEYENGVLKPARAALARAEGGAQ